MPINYTVDGGRSCERVYVYVCINKGKAKLGDNLDDVNAVPMVLLI
jgi:hypothetical protein